jgi:hypothetical protein
MHHFVLLFKEALDDPRPLVPLSVPFSGDGSPGKIKFVLNQHSGVDRVD